jgi:hypothetical protein
MKAVLAMVCALATVSYVAGAKSNSESYITFNENPLDDMITKQGGDAVKLAKHIRFVSLAGRGLISGYRRGMYKDINYRVEAKCLDGDTQK